MDTPGTAIGDLAVEAMALLADAVATIGPDDWAQPSNLDDWTLA